MDIAFGVNTLCRPVCGGPLVCVEEVSGSLVHVLWFDVVGIQRQVYDSAELRAATPAEVAGAHEEYRRRVGTVGA